MQEKTELIRYVDLDWCRLKCPCGDELNGRYASDEDFNNFINEHYDHTNGYEKEIVTEDGARVLSGHPDPVVRKLQKSSDF